MQKLVVSVLMFTRKVVQRVQRDSVHVLVWIVQYTCSSVLWASTTLQTALHTLAYSCSDVQHRQRSFLLAKWSLCWQNNTIQGRLHVQRWVHYSGKWDWRHLVLEAATDIKFTQMRIAIFHIEHRDRERILTVFKHSHPSVRTSQSLQQCSLGLSRL